MLFNGVCTVGQKISVDQRRFCLLHSIQYVTVLSGCLYTGATVVQVSDSGCNMHHE